MEVDNSQEFFSDESVSGRFFPSDEVMELSRSDGKHPPKTVLNKPAIRFNRFVAKLAIVKYITDMRC